MGHKCYISFKQEDKDYKKKIQEWVDDDKIDMIDKSPVFNNYYKRR